MNEKRLKRIEKRMKYINKRVEKILDKELNEEPSFQDMAPIAVAVDVLMHLENDNHPIQALRFYIDSFDEEDIFTEYSYSEKFKFVYSIIASMTEQYTYINHKFRYIFLQPFYNRKTTNYMIAHILNMVGCKPTRAYKEKQDLKSYLFEKFEEDEKFQKFMEGLFNDGKDTVTQ